MSCFEPRRISAPRNVVRVLCAALSLSACGARPSAKPSHAPALVATQTRSALIGRPCTELKTARGDEGFTGVFVEMADLRSPLAEDEPLRQRLATPVEVNAVGGALIESSLSVSGPWATGEGAGGEAASERMTLSLSRLPESPSEHVQLTLSSGERREPLAEVALVNQEPAVVHFGGRTQVVTAYFVPAPRASSLKALHACKARPDVDMR